MPRKIRRFISLLIISAAFFSSGCIRRHVDGDTSVYSTEPWAIALVGLVAASVALAGWYARRRLRWRGYLMIGLGVLVLCTTVPGLSASRTLVDPIHVEWNRGFNKFEFRFDDLARIEHSVKQIPIGKTVEAVHYLTFTKKTGETTEVQVEPQSHRFLQDAIPEIVRRAKDRGVQCSEIGPE